MALQIPTGKQSDYVLNSNYRINVCHGSVRSGKSVGANVRWLQYILERPPGNLLMVGKTIGSLERNVLTDLQSWVGPDNFKLRKINKEVEIYGRKIWIEGAVDDSSFQKIQGETLAGVLGDEVTTWPESFFSMLMSRLSEKNAKAFLTMNPGSPNHWFKKRYLDRELELNMRSWHFLL